MSSAWYRLIAPGGAAAPVDDQFADWGKAWPGPGWGVYPAPIPAPHSPEWDLMMLGQYAREMAEAGESGRLSKYDAASHLAHKAGMSSLWFVRPDPPAQPKPELNLAQHLEAAREHLLALREWSTEALDSLGGDDDYDQDYE